MAPPRAVVASGPRRDVRRNCKICQGRVGGVKGYFDDEEDLRDWLEGQLESHWGARVITRDWENPVDDGYGDLVVRAPCGNDVVIEVKLIDPDGSRSHKAKKRNYGNRQARYYSRVWKENRAAHGRGVVGARYTNLNGLKIVTVHPGR
jgi:hypothetical protein